MFIVEEIKRRLCDSCGQLGSSLGLRGSRVIFSFTALLKAFEVQGGSTWFNVVQGGISTPAANVNRFSFLSLKFGIPGAAHVSNTCPCADTLGSTLSLSKSERNSENSGIESCGLRNLLLVLCFSAPNALFSLYKAGNSSSNAWLQLKSPGEWIHTKQIADSIHLVHDSIHS